MSIQRWNYYSDTGAQPMPDGEWVTYADHLAAVAAAEQRVRDELPPNGADALWYLLGQRKGVQAARAAVAAMEIAVVGNSAATVEQALAAIDALLGESNG